MSQWLNDHWQYQLQYNSQADIPLQALDAGEDGQSYRAAVTWQKMNLARLARVTV